MTELDNVVLAVVARDGPLSAYDVRKRFARSLTPAWSSSRGAIYPSIQRLLEAGLVKVSAPSGARAKKTVSLTTAGEAATRRWISCGSSEEAAATSDPIRTKAQFLKLLDSKARRNFVFDARNRTEEAIRLVEQRVRERKESGAEPFEVEAARGAIYELQGRRKWLDSLARAMD